MDTTISRTKKEGSVLGGILLITGSCIGAGMLALPVITGVGGFIPALFLFIFACLFMTLTSLLLLEANLALGYDLSLISLAQKTLGRPGKILCWILFVFLFYSLSIAYIAASGEIVQSIFIDLFGVTLPSWVGSLSFVVIFGIVLIMGVKPVDYLNRLLMVGLIVTYCVLVFLGSYHLNAHFLSHVFWKYSFAALPVLIISFGYQNMVPSLAQYFKGDTKRLKITLIVGGLIPLAIYLIWEAVMLGIIPVHGLEGLLNALDQGQAATQALRAVVGKSWINTVAQSFALFAITTSFLAQSLSLVDFLADGLSISKEKMQRVFLVGLTLIPPYLIAYIYPGIFIRALNMAGGLSAVILFGVIPVLMIWVLRYRENVIEKPLLGGGKPLLMLIIVCALAIFALQLSEELGWALLPNPKEVLIND